MRYAFYRHTAVRRFAIALGIYLSLHGVFGFAQAHTEAPPRADAAKNVRGVRRADNRHPDLSGFWQVMNTADQDLLDHIASREGPAGQSVVDGGAIPYLPEALAKKKENFESRARTDPRQKCFLPGVPRITYTPLPFQILQSEGKISIYYEYAHAVRFIYTDGSKHPEGHIDWWLGDSRGHWEGRTLIVDSVHFNDQTWFDHVGDFHSDALHVVERYTLTTDPDHIQYEAAIDDPKTFSKPWTLRMTLYRHKEPRFQLLEYECYGFDLEKHYP